MERPYNARFCPNLYWYRYIIDRSFFKDELTVIKVVEKQQELTVKQVQKLNNFFHISAMMFLASE
jgi:hypothetical protein